MTGSFTCYSGNTGVERIRNYYYCCCCSIEYWWKNEGRKRNESKKIRETNRPTTLFPYTLTGYLRFHKPVVNEAWTGIRDATTPGPKCPQQPFSFTSKQAYEGSEDCLYLNVHAPKVSICLRLACLVWHNQNDSCIKMGSDESHFDVSLTVRDKVTRQCPQYYNFWRERRAEADSNRGPSAY